MAGVTGPASFHEKGSAPQPMDLDSQHGSLPTTSSGRSTGGDNNFSHRPVFVDEDKDGRYTCKICNRSLIEPRQTPCAERVCWACIREKFDGADQGIIDCPLLQYHHSSSDEPMEELDCQNGIRLEEISPDPGTLKEMMKRKVYCTHKEFGCSVKVMWKKLQDHVKDCPHKPQQCDNWKRGCKVYTALRDLKKHRESCEYALVPCRFCRKELIKKNMDDHLEECPDAESKCSECSRVFSKTSSLIMHKTISHPKAGGPCYYTIYGCSFKGITVKEMLEHYKSATAEHLEMMTIVAAEARRTAEKAKNQSQVGTTQLQSGGGQATENLKKKHRALEMFMGNLSAKVNQIEESMGEHSTDSEAVSAGMRDIQSTRSIVDDLKRKTDILERKLGSGVDLPSQIVQQGRTLQMHDVKVTEFDLRIKNVENASYDGRLVWRINDYRKKKNDAERGRALSIYSEPFYTSKYGYKMCGRVYLNGDGQGRGNCLSLFFVIMRGFYDELLEWPFRRKVTFTLVAPGNPERNKTETFQVLPDPESSSFRRPTSEMNVASGCPQFTAISDVESGTFLKNDSIYITIDIGQD